MTQNIGKKSPLWKAFLYRLLIFICTVGLIVYFMPRDVKFNYQFDLDKPWKYGQLIATFDFPIYKPDEVVKHEQDSILAHFQPYYNIDKEVSKTELQQLRSDYQTSLRELLPSQDYYNYLQRTLTEIYNAGIISNENLNDLQSDVVFIKNIDNVVPDRLKEDTVFWKQVIAGVLVEIQKQTFGYLNLLDSGKFTHDDLEDIIRFVRHTLNTDVPGLKDLNDAELHDFLKKKLNRPIRVCGVVKNVGEPGGGPFLAFNPDGSVSLQILESSQIDQNNPEYMKMFTQGTHFNPVDLVCAVRNYKGEKFNLPDYVDPATGFISYKSKGGKELKALELPGLWNGAMSNWSTLMVEVPLSTFNPVKTVNDLLRPQHQG